MTNFTSLSEQEIRKLLHEKQLQKNSLGMQLRTKESKDLAKYRTLKKEIAQLKTVLRATQLLPQTNQV